MADRKYQNYYRETNATLHSEHEIPLIGYHRVIRCWHLNEAPNEVQSILAEMNEWTSEKNTHPQKWVFEPGVNARAGDGAPYTLPGKWRLQANRTNKPGQEKTGLYQEIARGYLQAPSDVSYWPNIDQEARITKVMDWNATGKNAIKPYFIVTYPNVAQETVQEFCDALIPRGTLTNPTFDQQATLAGTWKFTAVRNEEQEDGSSIVSATLVDATDPTGLNITFANNCGSIITRAIFMGLSTYPTVPAGTSGVEHFIRDFRFDPATGMYEVAVETVSQNTLTTGTVTQQDNLFETVKKQDFLGVRVGDVDQNGDAVPLWTPGVGTSGVEVTEEVSKNQNCTKDYKQRQVTTKSVTSAHLTEAANALYTTEIKVDKAQPISTTIAGNVDPVAGVIVEMQGNKTPASQLDVTTTTKTATESKVSFGLPDAAGYENYTYFKNVPAAELTTMLASLSSGTRNTLLSHGGMNEFGRFDGHIHTKNVLAGSGATGFWWDNKGVVRVIQNEHTDHLGNHWIFEDTITLNIARGTGIQYGTSMFSGAGPHSEWQPHAQNDTFYFARSVLVMRQCYIYGSVSNGIWSPTDGKVASGESVQIFAAITPYGAS